MPTINFTHPTQSCHRAYPMKPHCCNLYNARRICRTRVPIDFLVIGLLFVAVSPNAGLRILSVSLFRPVNAGLDEKGAWGDLESGINVIEEEETLVGALDFKAVVAGERGVCPEVAIALPDFVGIGGGNLSDE
ncbi:Uncharacterized protein Adt_38507 [Abeliophyllum distichum]|uniref:Uncharacterized protein n=1 Tax=Abeliophyllum distichum TaxID=126358 RepID=A0ABD1Q2I9_9LAMI